MKYIAYNKNKDTVVGLTEGEPADHVLVFMA
jgi:hypothetical protein